MAITKAASDNSAGSSGAVVNSDLTPDERLDLMLKLDLIEIEVRRWHASRSSRAVAVSRVIASMRETLNHSHPVSLVEKVRNKFFGGRHGS